MQTFQGMNWRYVLRLADQKTGDLSRNSMKKIDAIIKPFKLDDAAKHWPKSVLPA